jgi:hypothetical protein
MDDSRSIEAERLDDPRKGVQIRAAGSGTQLGIRNEESPTAWDT